MARHNDSSPEQCSRPSESRWVLWLLFFYFCFLVPRAVDAFWISTTTLRPAASTTTTPMFVLPPRLDGESSDAYFERLTQAAADPDTFAQMALEDPTKRVTSSEEEQPKRNYIPVEEWDAAQKNATSSMTWEERVQFEGQQQGNRFRQNEILRQNLKGF